MKVTPHPKPLLSRIEPRALMMYYSSPSLQLWQRTPWTTAWALPYVHNINLSSNMGWNHSCARKEMYSLGAFKCKYAIGFILHIKLHFSLIMTLKKKTKKNSGCPAERWWRVYLCIYLSFIPIFQTPGETTVPYKTSQRVREQVRHNVTSRPGKGCGTPNCFFSFDLQSTLWSAS